MNKNDEDIDLRLALGSRNYSLRTRLNSSWGAGVNASSREDVPFAASDPLSELVWSPQNGLSLKCANNSSLADNKPFLTWNAGERTNENLTSENIKLGSEDNKVSCEEKLSTSQTMLDEAGNSGEKATVFRSPEGSSSYGGSKCFIDKAITAEENHKGSVDENLCSSQNLHVADIAESSKINAELDKKSDTAVNWKKFPSNFVRGRPFNLKGGLETDTSRSGIMRLAVPIRSEPPTAKVSEALVCFLPNRHAHNEIEDEVTSASTDVNKTKTDAPLCFAKEDSLHVDTTPANSKICSYREKGKGKALSDGDIYRRSSSKEDSHESVESCNSTRLFPKGVKRQNFDQGQLVESKRMRKCLQESPGSTSVLKANSSFMSWISNMVKGLAHSNKEDESSVLALTLAHSNKVCSYKTTDFAKPRTGFQNVFESLYNKTPISEVEKDKNQFIADSSELMVADEKSLENRNFDNPCKQVILSDEEMSPHISRIPTKPWIFSADFEKSKKKPLDIPECSREIIEGRSSGLLCKEVDITAEKMNLDIPLPISCAPVKSKPLSSLWITRLYTRNAPFEDCNRITKEALECNYELQGANRESMANDVFSIGEKTSEARDDSEGVMQTPKESVDLKFSSHKQNFILPFQELRSSDAMASVFAKRLDALRHIIHPSGRRDPPTFPLTCFFCGNSGHDLRKCPDLTETELENLLLNISSFRRVDDSSCLCIRCFQLDHWAILCPLASSQEHTQSKQKPVSGSLPNFLTRYMKESSSKRLSTTNELQTSGLSNLGNHLKDKQIFPLCKFFNTQIAVPQEEVFHAIRKLRLSRTDILRWMDSDVSLSNLNGFFLRLRLGKLEGGLGGTGYYVACITGDSVENIRCKSKKSVLVDVGGMNSSVGSQFISNHDFLEDEIKGWWSRIAKSGGKVPSLDELKSKLETRECLGL